MKKLISATLALALTLSLTTNIFAAPTTAVTTSAQVPVLISAPIIATSSDFAIATNGSVSLNVAPDIAYINLGIYNVGKTSQAATQENAKLVKDLKDALKKAGVAESDIKTQYYSTYPQYDYSKEVATISGYTVDHTLNVTVRDIAKTNEILDLAIENGANSSYGVTFDVENKEAHYEKALNEAIQIAVKKGNFIASTVGVANPKVSNITENGAYYASVYDRTLTATDESAKVGTDIQTNNVTISASVIVNFTK